MIFQNITNQSLKSLREISYSLAESPLVWELAHSSKQGTVLIIVEGYCSVGIEGSVGNHAERPPVEQCLRSLPRPTDSGVSAMPAENCPTAHTSPFHTVY